MPFKGVSVGDRVTILAGENKGEWGIVQRIYNGQFHVGIANGRDGLVFDRDEIRKPRNV